MCAFIVTWSGRAVFYKLLSNEMLLAYRLLCSQAGSCAGDPAASKPIIGTAFDVLKSTMVGIVGRLRTSMLEAAWRASWRA